MSTLAWSFILVVFSWQLAFGAADKCWDEFDKCTVKKMFSPEGDKMFVDCCNAADEQNFTVSASICVFDEMDKLCEDIVDKCSSDESSLLQDESLSEENFDEFPPKGDDCNEYPEKMKKYFEDWCKTSEDDDDDVFCKTLGKTA